MSFASMHNDYLDYDRYLGPEEPCAVCGNPCDTCICPECPMCSLPRRALRSLRRARSAYRSPRRVFRGGLTGEETMTPKRIRLAAAIVRGYAADLKRSHTTSDGKWPEEEEATRDEHAELVGVARELSTLARNAATTSFWVFDVQPPKPKRETRAQMVERIYNEPTK